MTLHELKNRYPGAETFTFGDHETLCEELISLVRLGKKTATCGALRDFQEGGETMPAVGRKDISLHWDGRPALVIETVGISICRFRDVDEEFALAEGEDETLDGWREGHKAFFERNGGFTEDMELVCERFRLIEDLQLGER